MSLAPKIRIQVDRAQIIQRPARPRHTQHWVFDLRVDGVVVKRQWAPNVLDGMSVTLGFATERPLPYGGSVVVEVLAYRLAGSLKLLIGSVKYTLRKYWRQQDRLLSSTFFSVKIDTTPVLFNRPMHASDVVGCRTTNGRSVCYTVTNNVLDKWVEACEVLPLPSVAGWPKRPVLVAGRAAREQTLGELATPTIGTPVNGLWNPPIIPLVPAPGGTDLATVAITHWRSAHGVLPLNEITWHQVAGSGAVRFSPNERCDVRGHVKVHGTRQGEVTLQARHNGVALTVYRAMVEPIVKLACRVTMLYHPTTGRGRKIFLGPWSSPANVRQHIAIANVYLRQLGVELVLDPDVSRCRRRSHGATAARGEPAIHVIRNARRADTWRQSNHDKVAKFNSVPGVINLQYVHSYKRSLSAIGLGISFPTNASSPSISDSGTPSSSWWSATGIPPDGPPARTVTMRVAAGRNTDSGLVVCSIADTMADPTRDAWMHGQTIAHEVGHLLGLHHRCSARGARAAVAKRFPDGVRFPPARNVMFDGTTRLALDFDYLQAKAVRQSRLLTMARVP